VERLVVAQGQLGPDELGNQKGNGIPPNPGLDLEDDFFSIKGQKLRAVVPNVSIEIVVREKGGIAGPRDRPGIQPLNDGSSQLDFQFSERREWDDTVLGRLAIVFEDDLETPASVAGVSVSKGAFAIDGSALPTGNLHLESIIDESLEFLHLGHHLHHGLVSQNCGNEGCKMRHLLCWVLDDTIRLRV